MGRKSHLLLLGGGGGGGVLRCRGVIKEKSPEVGISAVVVSQLSGLACVLAFFCSLTLSVP